MNIASKTRLWQERVADKELASQLQDLLDSKDEAAIADAFFQDLAFGTGGLRGVIGVGTNRMNIYTVGKATQGLADYLNKTFEEPSVAMARDSRNKGELFVETAACVLAANGIRVHIYPRIEPTPALSFAVRDLHCSAGICMTASHNPSSYNGYKAYGNDGCQITSKAAAAIQSAINEVDIFEDVLTTDYYSAKKNGMIDFIGEDTLDRYLKAVLQYGLADPSAADVNLKLVYTPLNGTGLELMKRMLPEIGVSDVTVVPEQEMADGNFPTCPYPNPEIREALQKGLDLCAEVHPDLLLATDPDADRVGIAVENDGEYVLLSGNEVGILMLDYICKMRRQKCLMPNRPVAVTTIVSTVMATDIANKYHVELLRTLTGFKYIGDVITHLEAIGEQERFIMGFEESYGYLSGAHVRDKDSINASMIICQMAQHYKNMGLNLVQAIENLYKEFGYYRNRTVSMSFPGADGAQKMQALMTSMRSNPPQDIANLPVQKVVDYESGVDGLPSANVLEFQLPNNNKVIFRPSGTEPKIKAYLFSKGASEKESEDLLNLMEVSVNDLL